MKNINPEAPVTCNKFIIINASPQKVWDTLSDIDKWAEWQPEISKPKLSGALRAGSKFVWSSGGATIHSTLHTVEPMSQLGWSGTSFGISAIHNWTLSFSDGQTKVAVEESMEGLLAGIFRNIFNNKLDKGLQVWLDALKKECQK